MLAHYLLSPDKDMIIQKADVTSAYLQAKWPKGLAKHFLKLPPEVWDALPEEVREAARKIQGKVLFEMQAPLYGHPLSGHIWIRECADFLVSQGWQTVEGLSAVLRKGDTVVSVYVDDLLVAGPRHEVEAFWKALRAVYPTDEPTHPDEFLGTDLSFREDAQSKTICLSMTDYITEIKNTYERLWRDDRPRINTWKVPMLDSLNHDAERTEPQKRVQKMVGMLLWLARNVRPDIAYSVSRLGSRITRWDEKAEAELRRVVEYLCQTKGMKLVMKARRGSEWEFVAHSDANLDSPRSQSGLFVAIEGEGTFIPYMWRSRRQAIAADSTGASELLAAHLAVREALTTVHASRFLLGADAQPLRLMVDNSAVVRVARRGTSAGLAWLGLAVRLRVSLLRDLSDLDLLSVEYVATASNMADMFSKALAVLKLQRANRMIGME